MIIKTINDKRKKYFWYALGVGVVLLIVLVLTTSMAKYQTTETIKIAEGTINYSLGDINVMAIYVNGDNGYEQVDSIPESGYELNATESYCKIGNTKQDVTINYDFATKALSISPLTQGKMKCYLYFDIHINANYQILEKATLGTGTPNFANTSCSSGCDEATVGLYTAEDDDGTSYYFRGDTTDNWVLFAGFYWRIIRINGNGSIRLIYNGTSTSLTGEGNIGNSAINTKVSDPMYVGFKYTSGEVHGTLNYSTILTTLNTWYTENLSNTEYENFIDAESGFCNDRTPTNGTGVGYSNTTYAASTRLIANNTPSFKCTNTDDLFTVSSSTKGNKALTYPIGLITADEVAYAGGVYNKVNTYYYLYEGGGFWTLSPMNFSTASGSAYSFVVLDDGMGLDGSLYSGLVSNTNQVRPVINLRADITFTSGDGTAENPYVVE